jgi:hypothetical protein
LQKCKKNTSQIPSTLAEFGLPFQALWFSWSRRFINYLAFLEHTRWTLFQKRVIHTKLDIYVNYLELLDTFLWIKYLEQIKTRYDYNLTIMKSPKPATDNRFKWTLCILTNSELDFLRYCGGHFENGDM